MITTRDLSGSQIIGLDAKQDYLDCCRNYNVYDKYIKYSLPTVPFKEKGYKVHGMGFKIPNLMNDPLIRVKQALHYLFTPVSYLIPELGSTLICVKDY